MARGFRIGHPRARRIAADFGARSLSGQDAILSYGTVPGHGINLVFINGGGSSLTTNSFNTQASGSIMLACVGRGVLSDFSTATVSDNKGNGNYTQQGSSHAYTRWTTSGTALYAKTGAAGGSGHTVTTTKPSVNDEVTLLAVEARGVTSIVDTQWVEDTTGPTNVSASVTTTGAGIIVAFWAGDDVQGETNPAVSSPFNRLDFTNNDQSNHVQMASAYRTVSGAGTYSVTWTPAISQGAQLWLIAMQ